MNTRKLIATSLLAAFAAASAHAGDDVRYYRADELPDPAAVARILGGTPEARAAAPAPAPRMRSIRTRSIHLIQTAVAEPMAADYAAANPEQDPQASAAPQPSGLALPVQFAFDSASILPDASYQLDAVAEGIKLAGAGVQVVIEGHTDAQGSDQYNRRLSLARAQAVKSYLVFRHGIAAAQLHVEGMGEAAPADPANPFAAKNRRVEFRAARG